MRTSSMKTGRNVSLLGSKPERNRANRWCGRDRRTRRATTRSSAPRRTGDRRQAAPGQARRSRDRRAPRRARPDLSLPIDADAEPIGRARLGPSRSPSPQARRLMASRSTASPRPGGPADAIGAATRVESQGVTVMRIAAAEALAALDDTADGIVRAAAAMIQARASRPLHPASRGPPPPPSGGG